MAEPTHIIGQRDTLVIEQSRRVPDVDDKIYILEPGETPLTAFLTQIGKIGDGGGKFRGQALRKRVVYNPEFTEYEDQYGGVWAQINNGAGYTTGDTTFAVDNPGASIFTKNDVVKNTRTGEHYRVTSVNYSGNTITVTRAQGSVATAALVDNDWLTIISSAYGEGSRSGDANTTKLVKVQNFTQIFRTKFGETRTVSASKLFPGEKMGDKSYLRTKYGIEHAKKIERAYLFGDKKETTDANGKPLRYTGGLVEAIEAVGNVQDEASSTLTQAEFTSFLKNYAFLNGSSEKLFLCGNAILAAIEGFAQSKLQLTPDDRTYGVQVRKYQSPFGILNLVRHPMFEQQYAGLGLVLDLETIKHCPLNGADTSLKTNIQENDADGWEDEYLTETGLQRVNFEKNALLKGVTG